MSTALKSVPVAPKGLPLVGHALAMLRSPLDFMKSLSDTGDLVRVNVGTLPIYFVTSAELTHELLVTKARHFDKGRFFVRARTFVGEALPTATSEIHKRHRRLMQPMFHQARIAGYADVMARRAQRMSEAWRPGEVIDVDEEIAQFSCEVLAETMFSTDISRPAAEAVIRDVPILLKYALVRTVTPPVLDKMPIPANRRFDAAGNRLRTTIDEVIALSHQEGTEGNEDLLALLMAARDADTGETLSDREVRDELVAIMFAGTETTASTLAWTFYELSKYPEVEAALIEEIEEVVGDRPVAFEDVPKFQLMDRVLREISRLHSVPLLMRQTTAPVELGGARLPVGTELAFSLYALHRDARLYDEPDSFDPDRWLPDSGKKIPRENYIPFGSGNRKCIGDGFAWTEIVITLATVLRRWKFEQIPGHEVREVASAVAHPDSLPMKVVPRKG